MNDIFNIETIDDVIMPFNRVLIEVKAPEEKTKGGIILTAEYSGRELQADTQGVIAKLGEHCFIDHETNQGVVGDTVITNKHVGFLYKDNIDKYYRLIQDKDILIIKRDEVQS